MNETARASFNNGKDFQQRKGISSATESTTRDRIIASVKIVKMVTQAILMVKGRSPARGYRDWLASLSYHI